MDAIKSFKGTRLMTQGTRVSQGLIYHYFENKEELLKTILSNLIDEVNETREELRDKDLRKKQEMILMDKYIELIIKI